MPEVLLITGGCRSGKSSFAQKLAEAEADAELSFIATADPFDEEMKYRVKKHQAERSPARWKTTEAPYQLCEALQSNSAKIMIVDCLTVWLGNLFYKEEITSENQISELLEKLWTSIPKNAKKIIFVSNEIGLGLVPEEKSSRLFRDALGRLNQLLAQRADQVIFMISGLPLIIKNSIESRMQ